MTAFQLRLPYRVADSVGWAGWTRNGRPAQATWRDPSSELGIRWEYPAPALDGRWRLSTASIPVARGRAWVNVWHRHLRAPAGALAAFGVTGPGGELHGVALVGRPVARQLDDGQRVEVTRVATNGTANACSALLGAACRWARSRGYAEALTYTLSCEGGASLRGAGFRPDGHTRGGQWDRPGRGRRERDAVIEAPKLRWIRAL